MTYVFSHSLWDAKVSSFISAWTRACAWQYRIPGWVNRMNSTPSPRTDGCWSPDAVSRINQKLLAKAGIEERVRFHDLRHTFATMALSSGVDVKTLSSMLGHYSAGFTLDTYTHITNDMQRGCSGEDRRLHGNGHS